MDEIKKVLIEIVKRNQIEDLKVNLKYWEDVISDIEKTTNEKKLLKIAQEDFGFDSFEEVKESLKNFN